MPSLAPPPFTVDLAEPDGKVHRLWRRYYIDLDRALNLDAAPSNAQYLVATANTDLTAERNLGLLTSGYLKITVALGIATPSSTATLAAADLTGILPALNAAALTALNASALASGTVPDARFPATLPAASGVNLTALNATQLTSGTVPQARKWTEATTTLVGNQDNVDFSGADFFRANNAALLTIRGLLAGSAGQQMTIVAIGAGAVDLANQDANSAAANRIITGTGATVTVTAATGAAILSYDGTTARWRRVFSS